MQYDFFFCCDIHPILQENSGLNIAWTHHLVLALSMPRLLAGCELKGAAWLYPPAVAVWSFSCHTLPLWPLIGSENGMRHSLTWCSGSWKGHLNAGGGKNRRLFSQWMASIILCSCIIFIMPRPLLWNNMLLRLFCFQTSYLLKLEALRWGGRDFCSMGGTAHNEEQHPAELQTWRPLASSQPAAGPLPAGEVWFVASLAT